MNTKEEQVLELRKVIQDILSESAIGIQEGHSDKKMKKSIKWAIRHLGVSVESVKSGNKVCPPRAYSTECYTVHKDDKGIHDLYRFLAKSYGVSKQEIEQSVNSNRPLKFVRK